mmetsp:Transcript_48669/g.74045  ORF Transcript_48669/g.74045 Transcript_48669/m.74045 type:complete len:249 (-) Transcript_48669:25-771(-)
MTISTHLDATGVPTNMTVSKSNEWSLDSSCRSCSDDEKTATGPLTGRRVSFSPWVDFVQVEHFRDLSPEEGHQMWYSKQEFAEIKSNMKQSINFMVRYGIIDDDVEFCSRGLETREDKIRRRENQKEAVDSVMNEQYLQRAEGGSLPELIAMLYSVFSFPCQQQAHTTALRDAHDVDQTRPIDPQEVSLDPEMPYPGEGVLQLLAGEGRTGEDLGSIEEWLVERFEKAERLVSSHRARQFSSPAIDIE